jgi:hypothetical protein
VNQPVTEFAVETSSQVIIWEASEILANEPPEAISNTMTIAKTSQSIDAAHEKNACCEGITALRTLLRRFNVEPSHTALELLGQPDAVQIDLAKANSRREVNDLTDPHYSSLQSSRRIEMVLNGIRDQDEVRTVRSGGARI